MELHIKLENSCRERKPFCVNCHNHFMTMRPLIKGVVVSKHFIKDLKNPEEINSIIQDILDCSHSNFTELHKFEEHIDGNLVFRAKKETPYSLLHRQKHANHFFEGIQKFYSIQKILGQKEWNKTYDPL
jgi:hypothetical protein